MGDESGDPVDGWASLGLDPRLLRALTKKRYRAPTAVQSQAIPLVLEGKDVVARAHTGSGKTAAYLLPAIHKIVTADDLSSGGAPLPNPRVLVLVPTRELAHQVKKEAAFLLGKCAPSLRAGELPAAGCASVVLREFAGAPPEILIATPARAAECVRESLFPPNALAGGLELLVLDEADLLLSFGYEDDIKFVFEKCRVGTQCMLLSATSGDNDENLARLESLVLQRPVRLEVSSGVGAGADAENENGEGDGNKNKNGPDVAHRTIRTPQKDKLLVTMALLRLGLCKRKTLVFVKDPDAAVKLRLFLDKFGVPCCALHAELPANSRQHILQEFNRGIYDYMIAAAEDSVGGDADGGGNGGNEDEKDDTQNDGAESDSDGDEKRNKKTKLLKTQKTPKPKPKRKRDAEFGVTRGVDFKDVRTVINFEVPSSASAYLHRVGRTGRAGKKGTAITLIAPNEEDLFEDVKRELQNRGGDAGAVAADTITTFVGLHPEQTEALRYRAEDTARSVGKTAVREARVRELKSELLNSERLAAHFEDNPEDLNLLKHDVSLSKTAPAPHLSHLPGYLRGRKKLGGKSDESALSGDGKKLGVGGAKSDQLVYADVEEPSEFGGKKKRRRKVDDTNKGKPGEKKPLRAGDIFKAGNRKKKGRTRSSTQRLP